MVAAERRLLVETPAPGALRPSSLVGAAESIECGIDRDSDPDAHTKSRVRRGINVELARECRIKCEALAQGADPGAG